MRSMLQSTLLLGVIAMFLFGTARPGYAVPVDCSLRDGLACSPQGATSNCSTTDEGTGCYYRYPCWCDRAFGPLQWRCGPNPNFVSCPVSFNGPATSPQAEFASWLMRQESGSVHQIPLAVVPSACL
jgi:hypothetical protein